MIDLNEKRQEIIAVATELFEKFVNMSKDIRSDDKERTGIQVVVWEPDTRNLVMVSIKEPSEAAKFFAVEKAVRAEMSLDYSSENSAAPDYLMFAGSLSVKIDENHHSKKSPDVRLTASTSGLKAEEDVVVSAAILAKLTGSTIVEIFQKVDYHGGVLPNWFYVKEKGYFQFLFE